MPGDCALRRTRRVLREAAGSVWHSVRMQRTLVAIPALNESATIGNVIDEVDACVPSVDILVVDDGSTDSTAEVARRAGAQVVSAAVQRGRRRGDAHSLPLRPAQRLRRRRAGRRRRPAHPRPHPRPDCTPWTDASVVVGARFTGHGDYSVRGPRRWAMRMLARSLSRVCRADLTGYHLGLPGRGPAMPSRCSPRHYPAEYLGDTVESLVIAARSGLQVTQVPVEMRASTGRHRQPLTDPRHSLPGTSTARALRGTGPPPGGGTRPGTGGGAMNVNWVGLAAAGAAARVRDRTAEAGDPPGAIRRALAARQRDADARGAVPRDPDPSRRRPRIRDRLEPAVLLGDPLPAPGAPSS